MAAFSQGSSHQSRGTSALCSLAAPYRVRQSWNLLAATPSQLMNRVRGISVRSDQCRTKSTMESRVSWGTQILVRVPQALFLV
jgi:hypothetical protein